uniref:non-specific serine/threonine protein kinase n=1 Tax=Aegilops tauschii TaxID=37682 RepID=R7W786_AEGTA
MTRQLNTSFFTVSLRVLRGAIQIASNLYLPTSVANIFGHWLDGYFPLYALASYVVYATTSGVPTAIQGASLTIRLLQQITDNFSEERKIGQGTYGTVYKGVHASGEEIAVKLLHNNLQGTDDEQFKQECDGLDWQTRYEIIKGICEGLKYLHEGFKEPIYHMDLKPDNILLDENMMPKLADFGLSKLYDGEQSMITQILTGTIGYLPPEYLFEHIVSKKLDIFSLGVVVTKIITGPRGPTRRGEMTQQEFTNQIKVKVIHDESHAF